MPETKTIFTLIVRNPDNDFIKLVTEHLVVPDCKITNIEYIVNKCLIIQAKEPIDIIGICSKNDWKQIFNIPNDPQDWISTSHNKPNDTRLVEIKNKETGNPENARFRSFHSGNTHDFWTDERGCYMPDKDVLFWREIQSN